ncbi:hypothetical protein EHS25_003717 [Saitozyma podzolica]|uniref:Uncharacterized protein n=1 Tax=Saitozyma podzolica TaxID=1890683 RepID=A0A427Y382_9TREE|nr:hypothetical protein EHS25_003717 [Saitozyma podzolica]
MLQEDEEGLGRAKVGVGLKDFDTEARLRKTEIVKAGYARWIVSWGASSSPPEVSIGGRANMPAKRPLIAELSGQSSTRMISKDRTVVSSETGPTTDP